MTFLAICALVFGAVVAVLVGWDVKGHRADFNWIDWATNAGFALGAVATIAVALSKLIGG